MSNLAGLREFSKKRRERIFRKIFSTEKIFLENFLHVFRHQRTATIRNQGNGKIKGPLEKFQNSPIANITNPVTMTDSLDCRSVALPENSTSGAFFCSVPVGNPAK